ncbi:MULTISPECIES: ribonuclease domain-containing protein [unclassified Streptomyces]|uniref:ribonuclease domain-containing protein n=1 Tax=unclassified Streptomyces TaxID=2593676 RepID=UPI0004AAE0AF|nr:MULTISPECIES: ribonuclease domain-containing protein [unclassified Streptomyces]APU39405.1 guanine-specific ribonuclease N1 and T1 [Streptomyces sp. TN58]KJK50750.1 guanine-specific ribonuclease N1 and T1 [Streptomyces sp. NRRL F-4428]
MIFRNVPRWLSRALGAVFLCAALVATAGCGAQKPGPAVSSGSGSAEPSTAPGTSSRAPSGAVSESAPDWARGMAVVRADALPRQAREVLLLIDKGGPYPYRQDGTVFGNFEKVLPRQKRGYYHEFTVRTPGERDRGARRIVTGEGGEFYYTDDHYETFKAVLR